MNMKRSFNPLVMLLFGLFLFLIFLIAIGVDLNKLWSLLLQSRKNYIMAAIAVDVLYIVTYGFAWYFILRTVAPEVRVLDALLIVFAGWFSDMLVPAAFFTGEVVRLYLLKKLYDIEYSRSAATIVIHRLLSAIAFAIFVGFGAAALAETGGATGILPQASIALGLAFLAITGGLLFIYKAEYVIEKTSNYLRRKRENRVIRYLLSKGIDIASSLENFAKSIDVIQEKKGSIMIAFIFLLMQWGLGVTVPYMIFKALGFNMSFYALALAYPIYGLADNVPIGIPVNAGVLDAAMISMFVLLGAPKEIAVSATIVTRSITVLFEALLTGTITVIFVPRVISEEDWKHVKNLIRGVVSQINVN